MNRSMLRPITDDQLQTFREDGVICLRGVLDEDWVRQLREALNSIPGTYATRSLMWTFSDTFKELAFDSPLGELVATFMHSDTCGLLSDIAFVKEPHTTDRTPWHHDQPYYQTQGTQLCGAWIGLDPTTLENGGLEWIKGSHKWGKMFEPDLFDGKVNNDVNPGREVLPDIGNHRADYDIVHFDTEPGDCIVNHSLLLHSGGPNITDLPRRGIACHYYGDNARFKSIPPARGIEDARDLGLKEGEPFPPEHELVPSVWPKRNRSTWPAPRGWGNNPGAIRPYNEEIAKIVSERG